jgi:mono/diheme cytochrome c family protein
MAAGVIRGSVIVVLLAVTGCDVPWHHEMQEQASLASTQSPRVPPSGALTTSAEPRADRIASAGRPLYQIYCAPCHGTGGIGNGPVRDHFAIGVDARPADLTSDSVQQHPDEWIFATITNGTARMPAYHYELSPAERWQIVAYVRQFKAGASR